MGGCPALSASQDATKRPLAGCSATAGRDLRALLQVSLLNEHHCYDDVEYNGEGVASAPGVWVANEVFNGIMSEMKKRSQVYDTVTSDFSFLAGKV